MNIYIVQSALLINMNSKNVKEILLQNKLVKRIL